MVGGSGGDGGRTMGGGIGNELYGGMLSTGAGDTGITGRDTMTTGGVLNAMFGVDVKVALGNVILKYIVVCGGKCWNGNPGGNVGNGGSEGGLAVASVTADWSVDCIVWLDTACSDDSVPTAACVAVDVDKLLSVVMFEGSKSSVRSGSSVSLSESSRPST